MPTPAGPEGRQQTGTSDPVPAPDGGKPRRLFLTGATGLIGRLLVPALHRRGWSVRALVRNPESDATQELASAGVELHPGDVTRPETLPAAMAGVDAVLHAAAWYDYGIRRRDRERMRETNVTGTRHTLDAALAAGVPRIVHVSSIVAFGHTDGEIADENYRRRAPPRSVYEETKTEAHAYAVELQARGAPLIVACPSGVFGPGDPAVNGRLLRLYVRGWYPPVSACVDGRIGWVHVDDVTAGLVACLERGTLGHTYILSAGVMRNGDLVSLWQRTPGGARRAWVNLPDAVARPLFGLAALAESLVRDRVLFSREFVAVSSAHYAVTAAKAERELGLRFRDLEEAWLETLAQEREAARRPRA